MLCILRNPRPSPIQDTADLKVDDLRGAGEGLKSIALPLLSL